MNIHVMHGRFQPFHLGHLDYAVEAAAGAELLVVGLTALRRDTTTDAARVAPHRVEDANNPLRFAERAFVVSAALRAEPRIVCPTVTVPFPVDDEPSLLPAIVPLDWCMVTTLHEPWNQHKVGVLEQLGYIVKIVSGDEPKLFSGSEIRALIAAGDEDWREMVPPAVASALDALGVPARLRGVGVS
jgi:nicotinamide-nucleotide adenylyltransferase